MSGLHVVLYRPEIPQNTGNIARTCAAVGAELHLIEPLGFSIADRDVRRAGLDYWDQVTVRTHDSLEQLLAAAVAAGGQVVAASRHGRRRYSEFRYRLPTWLVFGNETSGLPETLRAAHAARLVRLPMRPGIRSLNLANSVAIVVYEALRQTGGAGLA